MARIIDYEQDEDRPFGVGKFTVDDGSEYYLDAPEKATEFLEQYERESQSIARSPQPLTKRQQYDNAVARLAQGPNAPQKRPRALDQKAFDPMRRAVAGPGGGEDEPLSSEPEPSASLASPDDNMSHAPEDDEEEDGAGAGAGVPPDDSALRQELAAQRAANAAGVVARTARPRGGVDPVRMQREGVPVDRSVTRKGGLPSDVYEQQAADRATAYDYTNQTLARHQAEDEARAAAEVERLRGEALAQRQLNDQQQLELQRKEAKYQADRRWLEQDVDRFYDHARPDGSRFFRERGVFGNLASAVAQFMGAYAAIVSGSPNFANQILDKKIERDIDEQLEDFRRGKMKRDSQLARMAERGMSLEQMRAALRLQQEKVLEKEAKAAALSEGTREARQAYEALIAGRQEKFVEAENKFRVEALGETTVQADVVQPRAARSPTALELLREQAALLKAENEVAYEAGGGAPQERADLRADRRAAAQGKKEVADTKRFTDYGNRRAVLEPAATESMNARQRLLEIKQKYGHLPGVGTWDLLGPNTTFGEARQRFLQAFGVEQAEVAGEVKQLLKVVEGAAVRANAGTQTEGDVAREAEAMHGPNASEEQVLAGVERLTQRAITPLDDLNATYADVVPEFEERLKRERYERYRREKQKKELRERGEEY